MRSGLRMAGLFGSFVAGLRARARDRFDDFDDFDDFDNRGDDEGFDGESFFGDDEGREPQTGDPRHERGRNGENR